MESVYLLKWSKIGEVSIWSKTQQLSQFCIRLQIHWLQINILAGAG